MEIKHFGMDCANRTHPRKLAGRYSYAGREWVVERVRQIIGGTVTEMVHNHHNYAWRETHDGRDLWVVRKGATPAWPGWCITTPTTPPSARPTTSRRS